jgi:hypothetical protein
MPWAGSVDHKMALRALFCPLAALRWVLDRLLAPSRDSQGRHHGGVQRGPVPVDAIGLSQVFEQHLVQPTPDTRLVSVSQPAPARHPAPIPYRGIWAGRYSQGDARLQHEQDPLPVSAARSDTRPDTRGRPPVGFDGSGESRGASGAHNASGNSSCAMASSSMTPILLTWLFTRRSC